MLDIRLATDLVDKYSEIESTVKSGNPVCLTENGYGSMIVLSYERYAAMVDYLRKMDENEEEMLDECDKRAEECSKRYSHDEIKSMLRSGKDQKIMEVRGVFHKNRDRNSFL